MDAQMLSFMELGQKGVLFQSYFAFLLALMKEATVATSMACSGTGTRMCARPRITHEAGILKHLPLGWLIYED